MNLSAITGVVLLIFTILSPAFLIHRSYVYDNKVDAVIDRAQVSADREDMQEQLVALRDNLTELGWTSGHFALVWKTPRNDLQLNFKAVERLIERLSEIQHLPKSDVAYQTALDDIRGTIRELPNPGGAMLWVNFWWLFLLIPIGGLTSFFAFLCV